MGKINFQNRFLLAALPVISALFLIAAYPPTTIRLAVFIAFVPLFIFLDNVSKKAAFWGAFLSGFLFVGWSIRWFFSVLPLDWAGITQWGAGITLALSIWFVTAITLSFFIGVFGYIWKLMPAGETRSLAIASTWIILEYLRAWAFGIVWIGQESLPGPHWTFATLGYTAANFPLLLPLAKFIGLYGFGFLIVAINSAIHELIVAKKVVKTHLGIAAAALLLLFFTRQALVSTLTPATPSKKFALIQTDFPPQFSQSIPEFRRFITKEIALLEEAKKQDPDVIVLPEGSNLTLQFGDETAAFLTGFLGGERPRTIIDSARVDESAKAPQRIFLYDTTKGLVAIRDKTLLIPGGEYLPYLIEYPARLFGLNDWATMFQERRGLVRSREARGNTRVPDRPEGVLSCSAILSPSLWRDLTRDSAGVLINTASQAIFRGSPQFLGQTEAMIRFFAAENDRWLIQAANGGFSYVIDHRGAIREKTQRPGNRVLNGKVEYRTSKPPAVRFDNWPIAVAFSWLLVIHLAPKLSTGIKQKKW